MQLLIFSAILVAFNQQLTVESGKTTIQVSGNILFPGGSPDFIPPGSWLSVTVQDTTLTDVASVVLGKNETEIIAFSNNQPLQYMIKNVILPEDPYRLDISLFALITIGEKRADIKQLDYFSMMVHSLKINENTLNYEHQNIKVEKYE